MPTPPSARLFALILIFAAHCAAESRSWKSQDGSQTMVAEYLSRDEHTVTLRRSNDQVVTVAIEKLHPDERTYLDEHHPFRTAEAPKEELVGNAFGPLRFGDQRAEVEKKLLESVLVKTKVAPGMFGRTGLNGVFETTENIGGLPCYLYFDWTDAGGLHEVTLQTPEIQADSYDDKLRATWSELVELMGKLYGKPLSTGTFPERKDLQDGLMLASHLWRTPDGYSVLLGTGQVQADYNVNLRFTAKKIEPVRLP